MYIAYTKHQETAPNRNLINPRAPFPLPWVKCSQECVSGGSTHSSAIGRSVHSLNLVRENGRAKQRLDSTAQAREHSCRDEVDSETLPTQSRPRQISFLVSLNSASTIFPCPFVFLTSLTTSPESDLGSHLCLSCEAPSFPNRHNLQSPDTC